MKKIENGKATADMMKCGDAVTKWMVKISQVAWEGGDVTRLTISHHCPGLQWDRQERGVLEL